MIETKLEAEPLTIIDEMRELYQQLKREFTSVTTMEALWQRKAEGKPHAKNAAIGWRVSK